MSGKMLRTFVAPPSAARLTASLRDIGYEFATAVADIVDNSISAGADRVDVDLTFDGRDSWVAVADDGTGMTEQELTEAMRLGTRRGYSRGELGRYGLGLKTASLSQCRRLTVVTRHSPVRRTVLRRSLDLDLVEEYDTWLVAELPATPGVAAATKRLQQGRGTVVVWEGLDRVLTDRDPDGGWARRRLTSQAGRVAEHLSVVFHRYLSERPGRTPLVICVNGEKLTPWDPFATREPATRELPGLQLELSSGGATGQVLLRRFVLPTRDQFSSPSEFERLGGPRRWNRQQGLYIYRADRLIRFGGWGGLRALDEHTKLARTSLEFGTELDEAFHINVAKVRLDVPAQLRPMLERPLHELCSTAQESYRSGQNERQPTDGDAQQWQAGREGQEDRGAARGRAAGPSPLAALALRSAAMQLGHTAALEEVVALVGQRDPELLAQLGFI